MRSLDRFLARPIFFPRIEDNHSNRINSSPTAVHCFHDGFVGKQPVARKEYCAEYWLKELQENMNRCTDRRDITEVLYKTALNTIQSINHSFLSMRFCKIESNTTSNRVLRNQKLNVTR